MQNLLPDDMLSSEALRTLLQRDITRIMEDEEVSPDRAFLRVCIEYLGFDTEAGSISDGKGDYGIDFIEVSPSGCSIIQAKSAEFDTKIDFGQRAGAALITDLPRIRALFENLDDLPPKMNVQVKRALMDLKHALRASGETQRPDPYHLSVYFCAQAVGFTDSAEAEFDKIKAQPIAYADTNIDITFIPVFLGDLLDAKWRESNTKWRNKKNEKRDRFDLDICGSIIRDSSKSCVFFTCAAQLVEAYQEIGHQLFESNVRCEIKNSPVNKAIKNSLLSRRGREEFKHLNNGITIICDNFQFLGPKNGPTGLRVTRPGVINGLQTIKTLADSVAELSDEDYRHFREKCLILTRVHTQSSVADYRDLVKSTNNQNPMKPRNLRSNDAEQVLFERYFSEHLGWFYERKEGAWNAFKADHTRWSTINRRPQHFLNGRIIKKVDNEEIAQAWLSFIGFAEQAIDQKRFLFSGDKAFYDLIFLNQTAHHGAYYKSRISDPKIIENARSQSPSGEGMLAAYVIREFATSVVRSRKDNREEAVKRLKIEGLSRADQEGELAHDTEYLKGLILRGMLLMFVEYFGYVMFSAFADQVHEKMGRLMLNGSIAEVVQTGDLTKVKTRLYDGGYGQNDILIVIWELYNFCISQMTAGAWLREWQQAPNRSKFIYSEKTREPLYNQHAEANRVFKDKILIRKWTVAFNDAGGVEDYLRQVLK